MISGTSNLKNLKITFSDMRLSTFCLYLGIACTLGLFACKGKKTVVEGKGKKDWESTLERVRETRPVFNTLTLTGKGSTSIPASDVDMTFSYRINIMRDSLIWMRISKFGIEAARALITKDSVYILDRLNQTLRVANYAPAEKLTGFEVDYGILEDLLLGNFHPIPVLLDVSGEARNPLVVYGEQAETRFSYTLDPLLLRLIRMEAVSVMKNLHSEILYGDFMEEVHMKIPKKGSITVSQPEKVSLTFDHNRVYVNPDNFSVGFSVPEGYTRKAYP